MRPTNSAPTQHSKSQPELSIAIVSYNTCSMTKACLDAVFASDIPVDFELLIIDNNSSDGSASMLKRVEDPRVKIWAIQENVGFAGGNNRVLEHARGKYFLLLNPDTVVEPDAIERLLAFALRHPEAGIWGGKTFFSNGNVNPTYCWGDQNLWSLTCQALGLSSLFRTSRYLNPEGVGYWNHASERSVDIVSGCFFLTTQKLWRKLKGFDEAFFMYGEEADLCARARSYGYQPMITSAACLVHHGGASETNQSAKLVRLLTAKVDLIRRHFGPISRWLGIVLLSMWPLSRALTHQALASLGRTSSELKASVWHEVWAARRQWLDNRDL